METNKLYNPKSSKFLLINSPGFKKLLKEGYTFINNALVPADTSNFVFSTEQNYWLSKDCTAYKKNAKNYDTVQRTLVPKDDGTVMGINKRRITINSVAYKKLIKLGYTYNAERKALAYPVNVINITPDHNNIPAGLLLTLRGDTYSHVMLTIGDEVYTIATANRRMRDIKDDWYATASRKYTQDDITDIKLYKPHPVYVAFGPSYQGEKNCVIACLEQHYKIHNYDCDTFAAAYDTYADGVFECDLENISKKFKIRITMHAGNTEYVYGVKRNSKAQLRLYYHNNHVVLSQMQLQDKHDIYIDNLCVANCTAPIRDITNIISGKDTTYMITTATTNYRLKYEYGIDLQAVDCLSATSYYAKLFIAANPLVRNIIKTHDNIDAIHTITQNGITFCNNTEGGVCLDLKGAYSNFTNFSSYTGFPSDLSSCVETKHLSQKEISDIVNDCEGFALITCTSIFDTRSESTIITPVKPIPVDYTSDDSLFSDYEEEVIEEIPVEIPHVQKKYKRWVSFPYLRHRLQLQHDIQISYLMIGSNRVHLNVDAFAGIEKRSFHKVLGKFINHKVNNSFTTVDPVVSNNYKGTVVCEQESEQLFLCNSWEDKVGSMYYPHITSYVQQYTEIEIEKKYLELVADNIYVCRVWVDGIVIRGAAPSVDDTLWHIKAAEKIDSHSLIRYVAAVTPVKFSESFNSIITNLYTAADVCDEVPLYKYCITGEAGCGKSYAIKKLYSQMNNAIILVYTHNLARNYSGLTVDTIQGFVEKFEGGYETIIVDEYSMIGQKIFDKIPYHANKKIIIAGDVGQLKCIGDSSLDTSCYKTITLTKNYRQRDPTFIDKLRETRKSGDLSWIKQKISLEAAIKLKYTILCATHSEIDRINILGHALNKNPEVHGIKIDTPVRFNKTKDNYTAGDTGIIESITDNNFITVLKYNGEKIQLENKILQKREHIMIAYGETIHGIQGKTMSTGLVINKIGMFDSAMPYVAVSRVIDEDQLFLLE